MNLTTKSKYSLLFLIFLLRNQRSGHPYIKLQDFTSQYDVPRKYLEQLTNRLREKHYIKTRRGIQGGFALDQAHERISVAEIINLMDGSIELSPASSLHGSTRATLESETKLWQAFREIQSYAADKLQNLTIDQLV